MPEHLNTGIVIERRGDKYVLISPTGEILGEHDSRADAEAKAESLRAAAAEASLDSLSSVDEARAKASSEEWAYTLDFAPFSKVDSRDANGFLRVRATVTAPGVYAYMRNGKLRHELKPPDEIFSALHMESVHGAVVTDEHPAGAVAVSPQNSKQFQRGHSMSPPVRTTKGLDVDLVVTDGGLIEDAESGRKTGVSLGMRNTFEHKSGVWTSDDGSKHPYEVIQRNMVTNHIAIVSTPRVTSAQLHLDSLAQDGSEDIQNMDKQATLTIDGADFEIDANVARVTMAHLGRQNKLIATLQSKLEEATTSYDSLTEEKDKALAERDSVSAERDSLKEKIDSTDALDINVLVVKRLAFIERAKLVMTADHFDEVKEQSDLEIMKAACTKAKVVMTEDSDAYLRARFDNMVDSASTTNDSKLKGASLRPVTVSPTQASERADLDSRLATYFDGTKKVG